MADSKSFFAAWEPRVLSILRIVAGFLMIAHGAQKLFGVLAPPPPPCPLPPAPPPPAGLIMTAGALEFFGGLLILLGLFTRPTAFILSGLMAVAYFMGHAPKGFWPILNGGELAVIYSFVYFYLFFAGGGPWSVDYCVWGRRRGVDPGVDSALHSGARHPRSA